LYYIHHAVGYNYRLNNLQAAMGTAQLEQLPRFIDVKRNNYLFYKKHIDAIEGLHVAEVPSYAENNYWMYALQLDAERYGRGRDQLIKSFHQEGIEVRPLWHLNHLQKPFSRSYAYKIEKAYKMLGITLNIPSSIGLSKAEMLKVIGFLI
jgi:dTDP-4-amino-4,6-dideoxygalactose transaminase